MENERKKRGREKTKDKKKKTLKDDKSSFSYSGKYKLIGF